MDNTATLPPPAAHAAGPAIRRREGAAGKGFAAALKLAEAPGAPAAATAGPGPPAGPVAAAGSPAVPGQAAAVPVLPQPDGTPVNPAPVAGEAAVPAMPDIPPDTALVPLPAVHPASLHAEKRPPVPYLLQGAAVAAPQSMLPVPDAAADPAPDREVLVVEEPAGPDAVSSMPEAMPEALPPPLPVAAPLLPAPKVTLPEAAPGRPEAAEAAPVAASGPSGARRPLEATDRIASAAPAAPGAAPRLSMTDPGAIPSSQPMGEARPAAPTMAAMPETAPVTDAEARGQASVPDATRPTATGLVAVARPGQRVPDAASPPSGTVPAQPSVASSPPAAAAHGLQADPPPKPPLGTGSRAGPLPRDRPMMVAATTGQAAAIQAKAEAAPAAVRAEAPPERLVEPLALAEPPSAGAALPRPEAPSPAGPRLQAAEAGIAAPAGPGPAPAAAPAEAPAPSRPATPPQPPPPARQVAQVAIALSLGTGRAPRLTVTLEPEALGRVEIRVERGAEGEAASVRVLAERPETLALLQRDARALDQALGQAGVPLAEGALQFGLSSGDPNQGGGRQPSGSGGGGGWGPRGPALPPEATRPAPLALSLLDIAV